ncbi:MAG: hypothetical protein AAGG06_20175 [Pseudomonadota bacterium]
MDVEQVTSPEMRDGISVINGHHVRYRNSVWLYLGSQRGYPAMMVLRNARGETIAAPCTECADAEPRV